MGLRSLDVRAIIIDSNISYLIAAVRMSTSAQLSRMSISHCATKGRKEQRGTCTQLSG